MERNADPCTSRGCMWGKSTDGKVYVPYTISGQYSSRELSTINRGLQSFSGFSCIRFVRRSNQRDYLSIQSPQRVSTTFSKNKQPTMVPIPNQNIPIGKATQMSQNDINRLNKLYKC
ncbi:hypothetical protein CRUP_012600 [Coryphaenoides rupestris]|nr:hypothetical protein CRUP_012600 [Coryphaenoides rupestris]